MPASPVRGPRLTVSILPAPAARVLRWLGRVLLAGAALLSMAPAHADLARIRQAGTLKVAVYKGLPPFSALAGSQYAGIDVALAQALGKALGLSVALMPFDADENMADDLRAMVWRGHYLGYGPADVMLHVPVDRAFMQANDKALIIAPYYRETFVLVRDRERVPDVRGLEDLAGQSTGAAAGSAGANALLSGGGGVLRDRVRIYPEAGLALHALFSGEIAAALVTRAQYESALKAGGHAASRYAASDISAPLLPPRGWAVGMAVKAGERELAEALQSALDTLRGNGELARIFGGYGVSMQAP
ncbi:substrate-binding periplasmic protein [Cupriavidus taiwanensis]|uniref:Putative extracellular solute binding protein n=1 Tax=Cupriavidus taiwanensis TaxID=164546 RepID=A0A7Z7NNN9_9BURK|nr:transporter substrate-binding domain-containing protein [Cupriavidus taiwanensis]SOZ10038.1 putative extracellular solute binding protein [Cupriavidus taiwanensis]SOZ12207.1 putative extracellular solute binding protein [Cupriavidus taiwanensis]SOZ43512.1 putative extracellular solute binding protein [Cupriavidus taiwanensis]SPC22754.1 putative extracellular solute binding protein [Cupriavidus taiwanensis]SPD54264.1 putative extracellular solute binding protein [Cupriavidus taiwanensis]